jgi:uncharacterized protein YqgC (DUF456 family)
MLPVIPGQVLSFAAVLLKYFFATNQSEAFSYIIVMLLAALIVVTILDYVTPIWIVKKTGGSKYGTRGAMIGMILGIVLTPVGMLLGMFLGAFIGEMLTNSSDIVKALKISVMTFIGFLLSVGLKLIYAFTCAWFFFTY